MKKILATTILPFMLCAMLFAQGREKNTYVKLTTNHGSCIIKLYNEAPKHRDNFIKLTKEGFYDSLLFHRVIKDFMIQGGDPDSKHAALAGADETSQPLGSGDVGYRVPAEFSDNLIHKKGVLAAARDNNPEKSSSGCQFYIVQGKKFTDEQLDAVEKRNGMSYTPAQREVYKTIGGTPHLDKNYTVYGEVVEGIEMVDKIASVATNNQDRPTEDVRMNVTLLSKKETKKLEKRLKK